MKSNRIRVLAIGITAIALASLGVYAETNISREKTASKNDPVATAVAKGEKWLVSVQGKDGGWGQDGGETSYVRQGERLESTGNDIANTGVSAAVVVEVDEHVPALLLHRKAGLGRGCAPRRGDSYGSGAGSRRDGGPGVAGSGVGDRSPGRSIEIDRRAEQVLAPDEHFGARRTGSWTELLRARRGYGHRDIQGKNDAGTGVAAVLGGAVDDAIASQGEPAKAHALRNAVRHGDELRVLA